MEAPGSSVSNAVALLNPDLDEDLDGQSNYMEEIAGTDIYDHNSLLQLHQDGTNDNDQFTLRWNSVMGITYQVESNQTLSSINWHTEEYGIAGTGNEINWFDPSPMDASSSFKNCG